LWAGRLMVRLGPISSVGRRNDHYQLQQAFLTAAPETTGAARRPSPEPVEPRKDAPGRQEKKVQNHPRASLLQGEGDFVSTVSRRLEKIMARDCQPSPSANGFNGVADGLDSAKEQISVDGSRAASSSGNRSRASSSRSNRSSPRRESSTSLATMTTQSSHRRRSSRLMLSPNDLPLSSSTRTSSRNSENAAEAPPNSPKSPSGLVPKGLPADEEEDVEHDAWKDVRTVQPSGPRTLAPLAPGIAPPRPPAEALSVLPPSSAGGGIAARSGGFLGGFTRGGDTAPQGRRPPPLPRPAPGGLTRIRLCNNAMSFLSGVVPSSTPAGPRADSNAPAGPAGRLPPLASSLQPALPEVASRPLATSIAPPSQGWHRRRTSAERSGIAPLQPARVVALPRAMAVA